MKTNKGPRTWPDKGFDKFEEPKKASTSRPKKKQSPKSPPETSKLPKTPPESKLQQSIRALRVIAKQRPDDPEAQRRAQVATDLYFDSWSRHKFPSPLIAHDSAESRQQTGGGFNLPVELYYEIFEHIIRDYPSCPQSKRLRTRTLQSLACSCRLFQEILEKYLYKHPRSWMFDETPAILMFRFSLIIEPRRGPRVQSLSMNVKCLYSSSLWLEIAKLCPNLRHLEIVETDKGLSNSHLEFLRNLFSNCPNVTRLSLDAKTSDSKVSRAFKNNKGFLKFWKQLTHVEGLSRSDPSDIILISKRCPSLQRLKIDSLGHIDLESLLDASHVWGKTLRILYLNWLTATNAFAIPHLLKRLPVVEEVYLAHLYDIRPSIQALARLSPPRLKHYKGVSHRRWHPARSLKVERDICDMITSQADTLESISITGQYDLSTRVLKAIKKAKKLEFLNLEVDRLLTDKEREYLQAACPKLQICVSHYGREIDRHKDSDWSYPKCGSWGFIPDD